MAENKDLEKKNLDTKNDIEALQDIDIEDSGTPISDENMEPTYQKLVRLMKSINAMVACGDKADMYFQVAKQFKKLAGYKDSLEYVEQCRLAAKQTKKEVKKGIYKEALNKMKDAKASQDFRLAAEQFRKINGYKDSDELAVQCDQAAESLDKKMTQKTFIRFGIIVVCFIVLLIGATTSPAKYYFANAYQMTGSYNSAIKIYRKLEDYKDSKSRLMECEYRKGLKLIEDKEYQRAANAFDAAGDYKDSSEQKVYAEKLVITNSKAGDVIKLGKHDWMILELDSDQAFLMIKTALPGMAYNNSYSEVTWENSTLRQWLNSEFLEASFSEAERNNIILTDVVNTANAAYGTAGGNATKDLVYLMSIEEAMKFSSVFPDFKSNCWLRSPGNAPASAAFLSVEGKVMDYGYAVNSDEIQVRPVIWFNLK